MRIFISILALILSTTVFGQNKDRRAELEVRGRVKEISVSPNERLWIVTAVGETYYAENISSNWHYGEPLFHSEDEFGIGNPHLERISFFNNDTAIITGYISSNDKNSRNSGYFLTKDAGKTWELKDYGGDSWIYTIYADKKGNAWMGGLSKELYFSEDFGESWRTIKMHYKSSDRTYGIHMIDNKTGIASSDDNEILLTRNNWKNVSHLETPLDQKKYTNEANGYHDNRISKIYLWGNYIVINQNGNIFYTESKEINWKKFSISIKDFEIDNDSKKLFAITRHSKVILFSSPKDFEYLSKKTINSFPTDLKVVNNSLFVIDNNNETYKINKNEFIRSGLYTTDRKIEEPRLVKSYDKLKWGINWDQIYLYEDSINGWYRENTIDFSVSNFRLKSDSLAILWDGHKNNYSYSLKTHSVKLITIDEPLKHFLEFPIKSISINSGSQGCFHSNHKKLNYTLKGDSTLVTSKVYKSSIDKSKSSRFKNKVSSKKLFKLLQKINSKPSAIPTIKEFNITQEDKEQYLSFVDSRLESDNDFFIRKKKVNKKYYYSVLNMLDTLDNEVIEKVLNQQEGIYSTTSNWFRITITNQNNETIHISRNYYESSLPWNLPWEFVFDEQHFNCYDVEFSRFIDNCISKDFRDKERFNNKYLIMEIADYLYNQDK